MIVTDTNGCLSEATSYPLSHLDTIIYTTGINQAAEPDAPVIYPNPATNKLFIRYSKKVDIAISTIDNKTVLEQPSAKEIDITPLPCGIYIITLYDENRNRILVRKLVKE